MIVEALAIACALETVALLVAFVLGRAARKGDVMVAAALARQPVVEPEDERAEVRPMYGHLRLVEDRDRVG